MSFLSNLFGTSAKPAQAQFTPPGFNAGGLNATFGGNGYTITPSADRTAAVSNLANTFGQESSAYGNLAQGFAPGFSNLRQAQLAALNSNRASSLSSLSQNLAQRRVLGSSFAQNSLSNVNAQFNQDQSQIIAQTFLQELAATQQITQQQFAAARGQFQTGLNEMNLEASLASDMTSKVSSSLAQVAQSNADLQSKTSMFNAGQNMKWITGIGNLVGMGIGML